MIFTYKAAAQAPDPPAPPAPDPPAPPAPDPPAPVPDETFSFTYDADDGAGVNTVALGEAAVNEFLPIIAGLVLTVIGIVLFFTVARNLMGKMWGLIRSLGGGTLGR